MIKLIPFIMPVFSVHSARTGGVEGRNLKFDWMVTNVGDENAVGPVGVTGAGLESIIGIALYDLTGNVVREHDIRAGVEWDFNSAGHAPRNFAKWRRTGEVGISPNAWARGWGWPYSIFSLGTKDEVPNGAYSLEFRLDPLNLYGLACKTGDVWIHVENRSVIPLQEKYY